MEEWKIALDVSQTKAKPYDKFGMQAKERSRWCPLFTLMGATTNDGLLSKPFKDRFKLRFLFNTYSLEESIEIVKVHAKRLGVNIDDGGAVEIAQRGRGVPRILVSLLERCKDFAISIDTRDITADNAKVTFSLMKVDSTGLNEVDIKILMALYEAKNQPLGIDNLAIVVNESKQAISETIEPYLIQRGLITRTSRGRTLTDVGKEYLILKGHVDEGDEEDWVDIPNDYVRRL
jgi:Holliday junction DNA helicase RuvB